MDFETRTAFRDRLATMAGGDFPKDRTALAELVATDVRWHACDPIGDLVGPGDVDAGFWYPLKHAIPDLQRVDDIFLAGRFDGAEWVAATGHYTGTFKRPWLGIPATGKPVRLRYGEVYRLDGGKVAEAFILLDLVDLMRQAGVSPWRPGAGIEADRPGPKARDGVRLEPGDAAETRKTYDLVMSMLGSLFEPTPQEMGMDRYWTADMAWYGPGMIGATHGLADFFRHHQTPWMEAFPDWQDALEAPFFADGPYACYAGWPSIRATHTGPLLGLAPTGRTVDIRVMDWWRRDGSLLAENWIFIDFPHLFKQLGIDLFDLMKGAAEKAEAGGTQGN